MSVLEHVVERTVDMVARRETVFRYFTDSERFAAWWGEGSTIEPRPGGRVHIRYPNGVVAGGEVLEISPPERVVFTFGYESGAPVAVGTSRVTIGLEKSAAGTRLRLRHELPTAAARDAHVQGWRYQLAVFANVVCAEENAGAEEKIDRFFGAWAEADAGKRRATLEAIATSALAFHDAFSCTTGIEDLVAHVGAAQQHMPGVRLERNGPARQCQGTAVADWTALSGEGASLGKGTNVFDFSPDGRIHRVVGLRG
jgi:uncharacterized protein YndB with AHSA1/START domain